MMHVSKLTKNKDALLEGKLTHLRLYISLVMRELRKDAKLTQSDLAARLGLKQAAISKLESHLRNHDLESIVRHLSEFDTELLVAVKKGSDVFQVSDDEESILVCVPKEVEEWADSDHKSVQEYVTSAVCHYNEVQCNYPTFHLKSPPRSPGLEKFRDPATQAAA